MEDVVYTLPMEARLAEYAENAAALVKQDLDPEGTPMWFKRKHLPQADKSSGTVRFRSVTPKQQFVRGPEQSTEDIMSEVQAAAWRHRELAADHIAASLWIKTEAPVVKASKPRKQMSETSFVTIPTDSVALHEEDFRTARSAAGIFKGNYAADIAYVGLGEFTGDGRATHTFEVTYKWSEVDK